MDQSSTSLPSYSDFSECLQRIDPNSRASQIHGLICGFICNGENNVNDMWKHIFPNHAQDAAVYDMVRNVVGSSAQQLNDFSFEFALILPEVSDINVRAEALGSWTQGFLTGLKQNAVSLKNHAPDEVIEALNDLVEISKINFEDIATNNEDEMAYTELVEYVRLSIVMIFQELQSTGKALPIPQNDVLH